MVGSCRSIRSMHCTFALLVVCVATSVSGAQVRSIIPKPSKLEPLPGEFVITPDTKIDCDADELKPVARYAAETVGGAIVAVGSAGMWLVLVDDASLGDEGYRLEVSPEAILISARKPAGAFYAVQTLRQLRAGDRIPCVRITDVPHFKHRGLLLDVCRHFRDKEFVKRYIDLLAYHKLNVLHWHLTEDQGWRIEIKKYPKLTEIGAWRDHGKGGKYGGFYTQDDIREVVEYARSRFVTVIPEIEMPGHALAALASYPELSCTGGPFEVATRWGIFDDVYCAGDDRTIEFNKAVLDEVLALFPSQLIHIGGDECPKTRWKSCAKCQARIKREKLKDEHELQSWFIRQIDKYLDSKGRRLVGWDEILEGGLAPGAIVQSWRGMEGAIAAATAGHDTIVSPTSHCYLDYSYERISIEHAYSFDPIPPQLSEAQARHVIGIEGCIWAERTPELADTDRQVWPRMCALAEVGWSSPDGRDFTEFKRRLQTHLDRLKQMGNKPGP